MIFKIPRFNRKNITAKIGIGLVCLGILPIGGCITLFPKPGNPTMVAPMLGGNNLEKFDTRTSYSLAVDTPDMPTALSGNSVVVLLKDGSYAYVEGVRLSSTAPVSVQNIFISTFDKSEAFLATVRGNTNVRANYELAIDVTRFDVTLPKWGKSGSAQIDASVRLIDVNTRSPVAAKVFSASSPAKKGKPIEAAYALERATQNLAIDVMNWVRETKNN